MEPVYVVSVEPNCELVWTIHVPSNINTAQEIKEIINSKLMNWDVAQCALGYYESNSFTLCPEHQLVTNLHRLVIRGPEYQSCLGGSQSNCILFDSYEYNQ